MKYENGTKQLFYPWFSKFCKYANGSQLWAAVKKEAAIYTPSWLETYKLRSFINDSTMWLEHVIG